MAKPLVAPLLHRKSVGALTGRAAFPGEREEFTGRFQTVESFHLQVFGDRMSRSLWVGMFAIAFIAALLWVWSLQAQLILVVVVSAALTAAAIAGYVLSVAYVKHSLELRYPKDLKRRDHAFWLLDFVVCLSSTALACFAGTFLAALIS